MIATLVITAAVILLLVSLNALYVAAEFGTVSARRARVATLAEEGSRSAQRLLDVLASPEHLDRYIAACQVGITISSLVVGIYGQAQLAPLLGPYLAAGVAATVVLIFLTVLQVVFGELVPKSVAMRYPERVALATSLPMRWSLFVLRPFIAVLNGSALALMRLFGLEVTGNLHAHSPEELELIFRESAQGGYLDADEREMLGRVLSLENLVARQIMVPRTRVVFADANDEPERLLRTLASTAHTRFPVIDESVDKVLGVLNLRDLFRLVRENPEGDVRSVLRPPLLLPETNTVSEVWETMQSGTHQLAVLFDEYGGTVGIVTLEDILEEVVGEVQDEFDDEARAIEARDGGFTVRGDVTVSSVNRELLTNLPLDRADTLGGLLTTVLGRVPRPGDEVEVNGATLRAEEVTENHVERVDLALPTTESDDRAAATTSLEPQ